MSSQLSRNGIYKLELHPAGESNRSGPASQHTHATPSKNIHKYKSTIIFTSAQIHLHTYLLKYIVLRLDLFSQMRLYSSERLLTKPVPLRLNSTRTTNVHTSRT